MDEPSEIKLLKAKVALLETEKKELNSVTNYEENYHNAVRKGVLSPMSGYSEADNHISRCRKYLRKF